METKHIIRLVLVIALVALMLPTIPITSGAPETYEMNLAQQSGEALIPEMVKSFPDWENATLTNGLTYLNIEDQIIAYVFTVQKSEKSLGHMVVGSELYKLHVLEASTEPVPIVPNYDELRMAIAKETGILITRAVTDNPRLVYAGYGLYFAVYKVNDESLAFDMLTHKVSWISEVKSRLTPPDQYGIESERNAMRTVDYCEASVPLRGQLDSQIPTDQQPYGCAPASGAMVAEYYKDYQGYSRFYTWTYDFSLLYYHMGTGSLGTMPWNAASGFSAYAAQYPVNYNFGSSYNGISQGFSTYYYDQLKTYIRAGHPIMVMFYLAPYAQSHYCAVRGFYVGDSPPRYIIVNDPWSATGFTAWVDYEANWPYMTLVWVWPQ